MSGAGPGPAVDLDAARRVARDCGWTLGRLASSYLRGTRRQLAALRRALADGDAGEVTRLGHGGLGSSLSFGVPGMAQVFREIERAGEDGALALVGPLLERAVAELERVEGAFAAEPDGAAGP